MSISLLLHPILLEMAVVQHQAHLMLSEMVHFVQQMQYFINFEVHSSPYYISFLDRFSFSN